MIDNQVKFDCQIANISLSLSPLYLYLYNHDLVYIETIDIDWPRHNISELNITMLASVHQHSFTVAKVYSLAFGQILQ